MDEAAESVASVDAGFVAVRGWFGSDELVRSTLLERSVWSMVVVVVVCVLVDDDPEVTCSVIRIWSVASRRHDPIQRSAIAFIRGTVGRVGTTRTSIAWKTASKVSVKYGPRSRMRNVIDSARSPRSIR
ncbi:hypothetical protein ABZ746_34640 [Streptomyces sp. NPDC020096]